MLVIFGGLLLIEQSPNKQLPRLRDWTSDLSVWSQPSDPSWPLSFFDQCNFRKFCGCASMTWPFFRISPWGFQFRFPENTEQIFFHEILKQEPLFFLGLGCLKFSRGQWMNEGVWKSVVQKVIYEHRGHSCLLSFSLSLPNVPCTHTLAHSHAPMRGYAPSLTLSHIHTLALSLQYRRSFVRWNNNRLLLHVWLLSRKENVYEKRKLIFLVEERKKERDSKDAVLRFILQTFFGRNLST